MPFRSIIPSVLSVLLIGSIAPQTWAVTKLSVEMGWGGSVRHGRWTPAYITASDTNTRQTVIEFNAPQSGPYVMNLRQYLTLGPQPTTVILYVPAADHFGEPPVVSLRDADSGKLLVRWPDDLERMGPTYEMVVSPQQRFIGVTGPNPRLDALESNLNVPLRVGAVPMSLLPDQPAGYDALDLLVLHRADLNQIEPVRQQAIVDWVRGGGLLVMWPSDDPVPTSSPLGQILPCTVRGPRNYAFSTAQQKQAGFHERYKGVTGFELAPTADARAIDLLPAGGGETALTAYARDYGFGEIIVSPINLNDLSFNDQGKGRVLLGKVFPTLVDADSDGSRSRSYYGYDPVTQTQQSSVSTLQDHLANVPGAGRFGFSYVVWVVLGMMFVVGPVDWFILRRLGRQPWTWVTTAGWIGLITVGALYIGKIFKSGELHYRSITMIDQAGGQTVARTLLAGVYSPRTTDYYFDAAPTQADATGKPIPTLQPPTGWWEPVSALYGGGGTGMRVDVPFRQNTEGNLPQVMTINVWNMRALRGEQMIPGDPVIKADLTCRHTGSSWVVTGTVTNLSPYPLKEVKVFARGMPLRGASDANDAEATRQPPRSSDSTRRSEDVEPEMNARLSRAIVLIQQIDPGKSASVRAVIDSEKSPANNEGDKSVAQWRGYYHEAEPPSTESLWTYASGLSGRRSERSDRLAKDGRHAVVYGTLVGASPAVVLRENDGAIERHDTFVRAVVPLVEASSTATQPSK